MKASHHFGKLEGVVGITAYGTMLHLNVTDAERVRTGVLKTAAKEDITVTSIEPIAPSLEDVFATIVETPDA